jgi:hypothetical protein
MSLCHILIFFGGKGRASVPEKQVTSQCNSSTTTVLSVLLLSNTSNLYPTPAEKHSVVLVILLSAPIVQLKTMVRQIEQGWFP